MSVVCYCFIFAGTGLVPDFCFRNHSFIYILLKSFCVLLDSMNTMDKFDLEWYVNVLTLVRLESRTTWTEVVCLSWNTVWVTQCAWDQSLRFPPNFFFFFFLNSLFIASVGCEAWVFSGGGLACLLYQGVFCYSSHITHTCIVNFSSCEKRA